MQLLSAIFLFGVLHSVTPQEITDSSGKATKSIGDTAKFNCNVEYESKFPIQWSKVIKIEDSGEIDLFDKILENNSKYELRFDQPSTYVLEIKDVDESDAGIYACTLMFPGGTGYRAEAELLVKSHPRSLNRNSRQNAIL